jgi:hypothetical protein
MGRKKNIEFAKPLNVRLYEESYREIKQIARREGVFDSDVHRELVAEALQARREKGGAGTSEPSTESVAGTLVRIEKALSELSGSGVVSLCEEVQTLTSRVAYLSDQIALLTTPPKRHKPQGTQEETLFS